MKHDYIKYLKDSNVSLRLLRIDNAPLIISFLYQVFKDKNRTSVTESEMISALSDYLYYLNQFGEIYPLKAYEYLQNWSNEGFLHTWYEDNNDEPFYELTPASEKTLDFIQDLEKKDFVGTQSRLLSVFSTLKDIAFKNYYRDDEKIAELERQKAKIEEQIARIKAGEAEKPDITRTKEMFLLAEETARKLLSDFRQVEQNFRDLDSEIRRKQIFSNRPKGIILDDIFRIHDLIWNSDEGVSFKGFWEFLMSPEKQDELNELIEIVINLPEISEIKKDNILSRFKVSLIEAGDKVNKTNHMIIEQLRRFLSGQMFIESKRIFDIITSIEEIALHIKEESPRTKTFIEIEDRVKLDFYMDKPLFTPPYVPQISHYLLEEGYATEVSTEALYQQFYIDPDLLRENISNLLRQKNQITLKEIAETYPIEKGLAEIITYFSIAAKDSKAIISDVEYEDIVIFNNETNKYSELTIPQTVFNR